MKMCGLSLGEVQQFYAVHQGKPFYDALTRFMSSGRVVAMELVRDGQCYTLPFLHVATIVVSHEFTQHGCKISG